MLLYLLLLSTFVISAAADGYVCGGDRLINPTEENEYTWPAGWKDNEPPAEYSGKQSCEWQINVLEGTYAMVTFYKETDSESGIKTTYPNGKEQYIEDNDPNPYFFTYPQFKVNMWVSDDKPGRFSFKVVWIPYPGACQMNIDLEQSQPMALTPIECHVTFKAPHNVILVGFSTEDNGALDNDLLRQSAVFEGNSINGEYLGNLYDAKYNEIVSRTNQLTVYTFNLDKTINYTIAIGMDINAAGDVQKFQGVNCPSDTTKPCPISLNADDQVSAIATVSRQVDYIQKFQDFPSGSTLKIYEGKISDDSLLATVNRENYMNQFPLAVKNSLKIYHLDTGRVVLPVTRNTNQANYGTVYEGRYVNIHSFDFKSNSYWQDTSETFSTSSNNNKLYFNIKVNYFDLNGNTTLAISVMNNQNAVFSQTYTQSNPPPSNIIKVYGDQMSVDYNTYGNYTKGFQIDLKTVENEDVSPGTPASPSPSSSASSSSSSSIFTSPTVPTSSRFTRISSEPTSSSKLSTNPSTSSRSPDVSTTLGVETTTKTKLRTFSVFCLLPLFIAALN